MTQSNAQVALVSATNVLGGLNHRTSELLELAEQYLAWLEEKG